MIVYKDNNGYKAVYDNIGELQKCINKIHNSNSPIVIYDNNKKWKEVKIVTNENKLKVIGSYCNIVED